MFSPKNEDNTLGEPDRPKLEQLCCECYAVVKKETDRLLPAPRG
jgi:hypothetical protein